MKTVRRLYVYLVALISLEVVLWGLISLLRSIVDETVGGGAEVLAQALALILVGVPIFLVHWLWAQNTSKHDEDEKTAGLRALFFYSVLLGMLIPVVQNLLALINRVFLLAVSLSTERAVLGGSQTWSDNLIAILMNGLVALYFWNVLRGEWQTLPEKETFADVRRLHRYIWVLYSLLITVFGEQQIIRFLFYSPTDVLGDVGREVVVNGIALLVIGTPIWVYSWRVVQDSLADGAEKDSNLRLTVLYLLALGGVITVLTTASILISTVLSKLLGADWTTSYFIDQISGPISVGIPLGAVWAYYGYWLNRHIESVGEPVRQAGMKRVYFYILSTLGLAGAFIGVASLIKFIIDLSTGGSLNLDDNLRSNLATAIALIAAWLPLWLLTWRPMQAEALASNDVSDHARQSVVRKAYLYLALFAGVIGGMISAVALIYQLIRVALGAAELSGFTAKVLNDLQLLVLFSILLVYHLLTLRRDNALAAGTLASKQSDFKVLVIESGDGFGESVKMTVAKFAPSVPVTVSSEKPQGQFNALVMSGSFAAGAAPEWVRSFSGSRIIVPNEASGIIWAGGVNKQAMQQAAQAIRQLAEGQQVRQGSTASSAWMIAIYIAAALFGMQLLFVLLALLISTFAN